MSNTKKTPLLPVSIACFPSCFSQYPEERKKKKIFKGNMKPLHTPNEKTKMDVAGSCVLYVSKYFHLLLKFPLGVAKKSYRIVNTMVNLDSFYGETFPHPLKSLVSICSVTDKPKVLLNLPFCPAHGLSAGRLARWDWDGSREAAPMRGTGPASPLGLSPSILPVSA